jgi:uncharacterized protein
MAEITSIDGLRQRLSEPRRTTLAKILPALDDQGRAFIGRAPMLFMATRDAAGMVEVSPKGDAPGFVVIENDRSLLIPERAGNNLAFGLQNIIATRSIGLIFMLPGTAETFRVNGTASLHDDADMLARLGSSERPALLAIRVAVERCYFHCARSFARAQIWDPESWGERMPVSLGKIIAPRVGGDAAMAAEIDASVAGAATTRLWRNS